MTTTSRDDPAQRPARAPRRRLPAAQRIEQILDAALQVFSDKGYAAARIDDIGAAAQLSKGGIYTHFRSKEEIFEALLTRTLAPGAYQPRPLPADARVTVDVLVAQAIAPMYALFAERSPLRVLRLLLTDGAHTPQMVERWRAAVVAPYIDEVQRLVRRGVAQGTLRDGVLATAPRLMISPAVHAMLDLMVQGRPTPQQLAEWQREHVALLHELLARP